MSYDELGECDALYYRRPCVYLREGVDDRSCVYPECTTCTYAIGKQPYCKYAYVGLCTHYNCLGCEHADPDNLIVAIQKSYKINRR